MSKSSELVQKQRIIEVNIKSDAIAQQVKDVNEHKKEPVLPCSFVDTNSRTVIPVFNKDNRNSGLSNEPNSSINFDSLEHFNYTFKRVDILYIRVADPFSWTEIPTFIRAGAEIWREITIQQVRELFIDVEQMKRLHSHINSIGYQDTVWADDMPSNPSESQDNSLNSYYLDPDD